MGQTSSQLESTQVQQGRTVEEASSSSTDSRESTIQVMSTQISSRKHARAPSASEDDALLPNKKLKTSAGQSSKLKKHRVGRSVPQHVRGINIRPSQDAIALREVDPATSQNIQQTSLFGNGRKAVVNEGQGGVVAIVPGEDTGDEGDNIQVHHTPAKPISQPTSARSKATKQRARTASTSSSPTSSSDATGQAGRGPLNASQPIPAAEAPPPAEVLQRARQKLAVQRGEEALAQDPEWGARFAAEQDQKRKKSMLLDFIEKHDLDLILVRMFFPAEQNEYKAEDADTDDDSESSVSEEEEEGEGGEEDSVASGVEELVQEEKDTQDTSASSARQANGIPTPSTSSEPQHEPIHDRHVDSEREITLNNAPAIEDAEYTHHLDDPEKAKRVSNWLLQPQEPVEPDAVDEIASDRASPELATMKQKKKSQRKKTVARKSAEMIVDSDDEQEGAAQVDVDDISEAEARPKRKQAAKRQKAVVRKSPEVVVDRDDKEQEAVEVDDDNVEAAQVKPRTQGRSKRKKTVARKSTAKVEDSDDDQQRPRDLDDDDFAGVDADSEFKEEELEEKEEKTLRGTVKGTWTPEEIAKAEAVFNDNCNEYRVTYMEMCRKMTDWEGELYDSFKIEIYAAFPLRAKSSIRSFCQRRWHDYNTGPWSEEEDALLRQWHAVHPGNWVEIGCMIGGGRTAASCRDRWLGHLQYEGKLNKGPWTQEEEDDLKTCVEKQQGGDESKRIDWNKVAEDMGCKRAANKCRLKWKTMQKRQAPTGPKAEEDVDEVDEDMMLQNSIMAQMQSDQDEAPIKHEPPQRLSKKQKELETKYAKLGWGDVSDALYETHDVFTAAELDLVYNHESTFWSNVSVRLNKRTHEEESKFKPFPKLRRRCYFGAMERFGDEEIEACKGMARRAGLLYDKIIDAYDKGEIEGAWRLEDRVRENAARQRQRATGGRFLEDGARDVSEALGSSPPPLPDDEGEDAVVIPETQLDDEVADAGTQRVVRVQAADDEDDIEDSRTTPSSSRSATPLLGLNEFIRKCADGRMTELRKRPSDRAGEDYIEMESDSGRIYRFEGSRQELKERVRESQQEQLEDEELEELEARVGWSGRTREFGRG